MKQTNHDIENSVLNGQVGEEEVEEGREGEDPCPTHLSSGTRINRIKLVHLHILGDPGLKVKMFSFRISGWTLN